MSRRTFGMVGVLTCNLLALMACNGVSPNTPLAGPSAVTSSSPATLPPTAAPQSYPKVTMTLTGGNGPTDCRLGPPIGQVETFTLGFAASPTTKPTASLPQPVPPGPTGTLLILDPKNWPTDNSGDYAGNLADATITAAGHYYGGPSTAEETPSSDWSITGFRPRSPGPCRPTGRS